MSGWQGQATYDTLPGSDGDITAAAVEEMRAAANGDEPAPADDPGDDPLDEDMASEIASSRGLTPADARALLDLADDRRTAERIADGFAGDDLGPMADRILRRSGN